MPGILLARGLPAGKGSRKLDGNPVRRWLSQEEANRYGDSFAKVMRLRHLLTEFDVIIA